MNLFVKWYLLEDDTAKEKDNQFCSGANTSTQPFVNGRVVEHAREWTGNSVFSVTLIVNLHLPYFSLNNRVQGYTEENVKTTVSCFETEKQARSKTPYQYIVPPRDTDWTELTSVSDSAVLQEVKISSAPAMMHPWLQICCEVENKAMRGTGILSILLTYKGDYTGLGHSSQAVRTHGCLDVYLWLENSGWFFQSVSLLEIWT